MNNTQKRATADYASSYTEHLVKKEADRGIILKRCAILLLTALLVLAVIILTFKVPYYSVIAAVIIFFFIKFLWGFTVIEYESLIVSNTLSIDKIYSTRKRVKVCEFKVSDAEAILPYKDAKLDGIKTLFAVSSERASDAYCAIYKNESGEREAVVFNATRKMLDMLKYHNRTTVVSEDVL